MSLLRDEFGALRALAGIQPPGRSYADWHRFLTECAEAGVAAVYGDGNGNATARFGTCLGYPLLRRWRWLRDAEERGLPYADAEAAFGLGYERDAKALRAAEDDQRSALARAQDERDANAIFKHAHEMGL